MDNDEKWLEYVYPEKDGGREVLKNKYDIRNALELYKLESEITFDRLVELYQNPIKGDFDKFHLCLIHEYLFKDLYEWAGKFRTVDIEKGHSYFAKCNRIEEYLDLELAKFNERIKTVMSDYSLAVLLADLYVVLLNIHPFREGNGRTIREFIREFSIEMSKDKNFGCMELDWRDIDKAELNKDIEVAHIYPSLTASLFRKALKSKGKAK